MVWVFTHTIATMTQENLTLEEAKEKVREKEDSIQSLINPSDLTHQNVDTWEKVNVEKLREELAMGMGDAWTYGINHPYGDLIEELAVNRYVEDMQRVPKNDLNPEKFKGIEDMVISGYWPYETSREEIRELVWEWNEDIEFFHEYEFEIMQEIESAILEARLKDFE